MEEEGDGNSIHDDQNTQTEVINKEMEKMAKQSSFKRGIRRMIDILPFQTRNPAEFFFAHKNDIDVVELKREIDDLIKTPMSKLEPFSLQYYFYLWAIIESAESNEHAVINYEFVEKLINKMDINYKSEYGDTALHEAVKISENATSHPVTHLNLIEYLIENEADIYQVNNFGQSVLHIAAAWNNSKWISYILDKDIKCELLNLSTIGESQTPMHFAARSGSLEAVNVLYNAYLNDANKEFYKILELKDYQGRTPLYLAAEYGYPEIVKKLISLNAEIDVTNIYGQKALYWICSKCPEIAYEMLNYIQKIDIATLEINYKLDKLEPQPYYNEQDKIEIPTCESLLVVIAEREMLNLIVHPTMEALIEAKWKDFARTRCFINMGQTVIDLVVWNLIGVLVAPMRKHIYTMPEDWWRVLLWILAFLGILWSALFELLEIFNIIRFKNMAFNERSKELLGDETYCHPNDHSQKLFIKQEKMGTRKRDPMRAYITDLWNVFDIVTIVLLIVVIVTHVVDAIDHTPDRAKIHVRVFAVALVLIAMRIFEIGQVLYQKFGILVVTLSFLVEKIIAWLVVYAILELSFTSAFWILFGYAAEPPQYFTSYNLVIFNLWVATFGRSPDIDTMFSLDGPMTCILVGLFVGVIALLLINVFIALLSSTQELVTDKARAFFLLQRANRIIAFERQLPNWYRIQHLKRLRKSYKTNISFETNEWVKLFSKDAHNKESVESVKTQVGGIGQKVGSMTNTVRKGFRTLVNKVGINMEPENREEQKPQEEADHPNLVNKLSGDIKALTNILKNRMPNRNT